MAIRLTSIHDTSVNRQTKGTISPYNRLRNRIIKEFPRKQLIGDIVINDQEYAILEDYFKVKCSYIIRNGGLIENDPVFATAFVQIGIKYYDGNLWSHVSKLLGLSKLNRNHRRGIGESFIRTLAQYQKLLIDKNEIVNNVLMHGFVSDYYANDMFEFLFKYYTLDLERDLSRNTSDMMNNLMEIVQRSDNTGRTYLLVKQTAHALGLNPKGGKIRLRRLLRLIDRCFWEQIKPANPVSRLSNLFNKWVENSTEFQQQYRKYHALANHSWGKKSFSSPYLKCDFENTQFRIVLPTQLINTHSDSNLQWLIQINDRISFVPVSIYPAVTGYKTEECDFPILIDELFHGMQFELLSNGERVRLFKIKPDCIRFFDKQGNMLNSDNLPKGLVIAFTHRDEIPLSEAVIDNIPIKGLLRSEFEFEYGDIVRLPDGHAISIGKKIEEGLSERKLVRGVQAVTPQFHMPVYSSAPTLLLKIPARKSKGTAIIINNRRYRLFDHDVTTIDFQDRSFETGYILNLTPYCTRDGIYEVYVDVPNDRTNRMWHFALVHGFQYEFEDAPYIFKSKGTILFNDRLKLRPLDKGLQKNSDQNSYNFEIRPETDHVNFGFAAPSEEIHLSFELPVFKWKFDDGSWQVEMPPELWHSELPTMIYMKYPTADKLKFRLDENIHDESNTIEQVIPIQKSKTKGIFECDLTRLKTWLGGETILRTGYLEFPHIQTEFMRIYTRSVVNSVLLTVNFESNILHGKLDLTGKSDIYVDVERVESYERLAEKLPVTNGKFKFNGRIGSGLYRVSVYEKEEDDTGFGIPTYLPIGTFEQHLTNPWDLSGKSFELNYIKKGHDSMLKMSLGCKYMLSQLCKIESADSNRYKGKLIVLLPKGPNTIAYDVNVEFPNLNQLQYAVITYFDGYDDIEFLYDNQRKHIVMKEEEGLKRSVKYRRYEVLYSDEYVFHVTPRG